MYHKDVAEKHKRQLTRLTILCDDLSVQILRQLKHENIIEMLDAFESPQEFCVVTEFAQVRSYFTASCHQDTFLYLNRGT